jgi:hypothetical protein
MAKISPPEKGQPLDVSYIYQLANAINSLSDDVGSASTNKYVTVETGITGAQSLRTSQSRFVGGYYQVVNNTNVTATEDRPFFYDFKPEFKYAPIVTASPINVGGTDAGKDVTVILKSITTSRVEGIVKFNKSGTLTVGVNIIAIGIPN